MRKESQAEMRKLKDDGYSIEYISAKCIRPAVGKKRALKKKGKLSFAQKNQQKKHKNKGKQAEQADQDVEPQEVGC